MTRLLPLFFLYFIILVVFTNNNLTGDESRYVFYAENLTKGYYADSQDPDIANGPVYPMMLAPFIALDLPYKWIKVFNGVLAIISVALMFQTLNQYFCSKNSLAISYLFGLYPPLLYWMTQLYSDTLAIFFISGFLYFYTRISRNSGGFKDFLAAALMLGLLALTRVIFGYVLVAFMLSILLYSLVWRKRPVRVTIQICLLALLVCVPFLFYTYSITDRLFCWGTNGGEQLYWMTSPYDNEYGDWVAYDRIKTLDNANQHLAFFDSLNNLSQIERNDAILHEAIGNFNSYPEKYVFHYFANIGRFLFNFPSSSRPQSLGAYFYICSNIFLIIGAIVSIVLFILRRSLVPVEIVHLGFFFLIYLSSSSIMSARPRYFMLAVPFLVIWIFVILNKTIRIELKSVLDK